MCGNPLTQAGADTLDGAARVGLGLKFVEERVRLGAVADFCEGGDFAPQVGKGLVKVGRVVGGVVVLVLLDGVAGSDLGADDRAADADAEVVSGGRLLCQGWFPTVNVTDSSGPPGRPWVA